MLLFLHHIQSRNFSTNTTQPRPSQEDQARLMQISSKKSSLASRNTSISRSAGSYCIGLSDISSTKSTSRSSQAMASMLARRCVICMDASTFSVSSVSHTLTHNPVSTSANTLQSPCLTSSLIQTWTPSQLAVCERSYRR